MKILDDLVPGTVVVVGGVLAKIVDSHVIGGHAMITAWDLETGEVMTVPAWKCRKVPRPLSGGKGL